MVGKAVSAPLDDDDVVTLRASWRRVAPLSSLVGDVFYGRLFAEAPEVRPMFSGEQRAQATKFMETLAAMVDALDDGPRLAADLHALGARHAGYGARPEHYAAVGRALLWTLRTAVAPPLDERELRTWARAYELAAALMQAGEGSAGCTPVEPAAPSA